MRNNAVVAASLAAILIALLGLAATSSPAPVDPLDLPAFVDTPAAFRTGPTMELPRQLREQNWGGGSCVHASTVMLLRWQKLFDVADKWRRTYSGGEYSSRLIQRMEAAGLRYSYTLDGDEKFLEWAIQTRRGAGIFYKPNHAICLVGLDQNYAYLLDNNAIDYPERFKRYEMVPRAEFMRRWKHEFGGFAWTPVYYPPPMLPAEDPQT
jgi:hypothetical protein